MHARGFLILHGWQNHRPVGHWQRWLAQRLRASGEHVRYPQLPRPDMPVLGEWLSVLEDELAALDAGERVVIAHSLGCLLWLQHARRAGAGEAVDRLLLVCPPGPAALPRELAAFHRPLPGAGVLARSVRGRPELVCTDADPWCPEGARALYGGRPEILVHLVPGGGHLSMDDGYGSWPAVEAWARTGALAPVRRAA